VAWVTETGIATLSASATSATSASRADFNLSVLPCIRHIVVERSVAERLLVHTTTSAIAIELRGDKISEGSVNVVFHVAGLGRARSTGAMLIALPHVLTGPPRHRVKSVRRNLLCNALISLDGRRAGASYREMASVAFGHKRALAAWNSPSRAMKDQVIRAHDKGVELVAGGYLKLLR
jgi:hypothetical protein